MLIYLVVGFLMGRIAAELLPPPQRVFRTLIRMIRR
jgi:hypothetical protein